MEPAPRHAEETAHNGRLERSAMGFDDGVLQSDRWRAALIPHRPSQVSTTTPKVSVEAWEVQISIGVSAQFCNVTFMGVLGGFVVKLEA